VGRYFGREPHVSQKEAEAQAKQVIDSIVSKGRPPADEWKGLASRTGEISRELAVRPPVEIPPPPPRRAPAPTGEPVRRRPVNQILRPQPAPEPEPEPAPPAPPAAAAAPAPPVAPARKRPPRPPAAAPAKRAAPVKRAAPAAEKAARPAAKRAAPKKRPG
jgi:hypothetical protein